MNTLLLTVAIVLSAQSGEQCFGKSLIVDERAYGPIYRGCAQVEYIVTESFPATALLGRLEERIEADGWKPIDGDPFRPGVPEPRAHAWGEYDLEDQARTRVDQWMGWFIRSGSRLQLSLQYIGRSPDDMTPLPVIVKVTHVTPKEWRSRPRAE